MPKDRQEIIAVLDRFSVGALNATHAFGYREEITDALMALPDVGDEPLRELLSFFRTQGVRADWESPFGDGYKNAMKDAADRLAAVLDGER